MMFCFTLYSTQHSYWGTVGGLTVTGFIYFLIQLLFFFVCVCVCMFLHIIRGHCGAQR